MPKWLIIGWLFFLPGVAVAEMLIGTVQTVDEENRLLILQLYRSDRKSDGNDAAGEPVVVRLVDDFSERRGIGRVFPGCVAPGNRIRVWGSFTEQEGEGMLRKTFLTTDIRGTGHCCLGDPTGVRSRIGRGCGQGRRGYGRFGSGHGGDDGR